MKLVQTKEGKARIFVPEGRIYDQSVFFNPEAELVRDISVSAIQAFQKQSKIKLNICDALAGTGIRGIRYAKEIKGIESVNINDKNPLAVRLIKKNIKENLNKKSVFLSRTSQSAHGKDSNTSSKSIEEMQTNERTMKIKENKIRKAKVTKKDANILLSEKVFNVIELDPFGSPAPFIDSAARSVWHKGFLCITATDQAPLCGTYPEKCFKRYGIRSLKTEYYNELGLRILISFIILNLARHEKAFLPLLSFSTQHYFRVFGQIQHKGEIKKILREFGYVNHCFGCGNRKFGKLEFKCECGKEFERCGPIYLGKIQDKKFCIQVLADLKQRKFRLEKEEVKLIDSLKKEQDPFYFDMHELGKLWKKSVGKFESYIKKLKQMGFGAERTHFCRTGIKTNAELKDIRKIF